MGAHWLVVLVAAGCDFGYQIGPFSDASLALLDASPRDAARGSDGASSASADGGRAADAAAMADAAATCPSGEAIVTISSFTFKPMHLEVTVGTRVTWVNEDVPHDVAEGQPGNLTPLFASPLLDTGEKWSYDFCDPGKVVYYCAQHPNLMRDATVTVKKP